MHVPQGGWSVSSARRVAWPVSFSRSMNEAAADEAGRQGQRAEDAPRPSAISRRDPPWTQVPEIRQRLCQDRDIKSVVERYRHQNGRDERTRPGGRYRQDRHGKTSRPHRRPRRKARQAQEAPDRRHDALDKAANEPVEDDAPADMTSPEVMNDDTIEDSAAPLIEHLAELRTRIIRSADRAVIIGMMHAVHRRGRSRFPC